MIGINPIRKPARASFSQQHFLFVLIRAEVLKGQINQAGKVPGGLAEHLGFVPVWQWAVEGKE